MHKAHMTGCVIAIGIAVALFATTGGSVGGLGLLLAVVICPIAMAAGMWFLMGSQRQRGASRSEELPPDEPVLDTTSAPRR